MAEEDLHTWADDRLLEALSQRVGQLSREAINFEIQRRFAQRQLEAAEGLRQLTRGLRNATWVLAVATIVLIAVTALQLFVRWHTLPLC